MSCPTCTTFEAQSKSVPPRTATRYGCRRPPMQAAIGPCPLVNDERKVERRSPGRPPPSTPLIGPCPLELRLVQLTICACNATHNAIGNATFDNTNIRRGHALVFTVVCRDHGLKGLEFSLELATCSDQLFASGARRCCVGGRIEISVTLCE
mmetsp:Transcript_34555/g.91743  ORF Transcript_34555/g.91743 Transcript_34555/m.91743 type:complete len:152 (-) Transcript_34555:2989-3444(-)